MKAALKAAFIATLILVATLAFAQEQRVPDAEQFVGNPKGAPVPAAQLYERTNQVAALLRCPVCQGLSVADSPSEMAINMKGQVRDLLARGYTEEQILQYFELSYGQFVLLEPKFEGVTSLVWLLPLAGLVVGGIVVFFAVRRLSATPAKQSAPVVAPPADDPYLTRVRELVSGGKE